jgi:surface carbohydrate biosynthesis protein
MSDNSHLIVPVETAARELDAKLLLSLFAANRGMTVTLGNKALLNLRIGGLRPGTYLSHNFNAGRDRIISLTRRLGHLVAAWDEEGLVWISEEIYRRRRANPHALSQLDLLMLWGEEQKKALMSVASPLSAKMVVCGNPRADLLRPELRSLYRDRAKALQAELGNFILVNSNFGWINHALARGRQRPIEEYLKEVAEKSGFPLAYLHHRYRIYRAFIAVIPRIARRFPTRNIVVRPHPSESRDGWLDEVKGLKNISVRYDNELVSWLLAAGHIVQNGCTTAVETGMLGRAAISYRPIVVPEHEIPQPHRVSHTALTEDELLELLSDDSITGKVPEAFRTALRNMVAGTDGALACSRIVDELGNIHRSRPAPPRAGRRIAQAGAFARRVEKAVLRHVPGSASQAHYVSQKFPPIGAAAISARLAAMSGLVALSLPRVTEIADRIFRIEPAPSSS